MTKKLRFKKFVNKHKVTIALVGGVAVGVVIGSVLFRSGGEIEIPEWVDTWKKHCNANGLLYENGLAIFANSEGTKIYRDAVADGYIQSLIDDGFEIIDR